MTDRTRARALARESIERGDAVGWFAESPGQMPWPLTRAEVEAIATPGLALASFEDFLDAEDPPVRRFRALFRRAGD